jgi:excisionase family DNA binding protein
MNLAKSSITQDAPLAFTITDAARKIGVSSSLIWKLARTGRLDLVRVGGRTLVRADDLQKLINGGSR